MPAGIIERTVDTFTRVYGVRPSALALAPGRVNIIGEHTDYNDGHVLPIAIDRYTCIALRPRADRRLRLHSANLDRCCDIDVDAPPAKREAWINYLLGMFVGIERSGRRLPGLDAAVWGTVPLGAGLSSSAAYEISFATALERLLGFVLTDVEVVTICRWADRHYVGINSGPMDQFASRACRAGYAGLLDCRSLEMVYHALPPGLAFCSVYSGVPRALVGTEYNERQAACAAAVAESAKIFPEIRALRDVTPALLEEIRPRLDARSFRLARHVVSEQERVFAMVEAFARGDHAAIATLLAAGHASLSGDYEVSLPILDRMVEWLAGRKGVVGARLTGTGFGGSLMAIVDQDIDIDALSAVFLDTFNGQTAESPNLVQLLSVDGARFRLDSVPAAD